MNPIYERVKQAVSLEQAMRFYGCDPGRGGMARCPFHGADKHPSMNVKNNFYFCHTCGAHGDVIGFVGQYFGLRPSDAVMKLDADFGLHLMNARPDRKAIRAAQLERERREREEAAFFAEYQTKTIIYRALWWAMVHCPPEDDRFVAACRYLPLYEDWFDRHPVSERGKEIA